MIACCALVLAGAVTLTANNALDLADTTSELVYAVTHMEKEIQDR